MQELISNIQTTVEVYQSIGKILLLLIGVLGLMTVKSNQRIRVIILYVIIGSAIVINPFFMEMEGQLLGETKLYRLGMVLLIPIISAYAFTVLFKKLSLSKQKWIAMAGILLMIAFSGKLVYTDDYFYKMSNSGKVYDLAVEIADCVTKTKEAPTVAISELQGVFIRQYNPNIKLVCTPEITENWVENENESIITMRAILADGAPDMASLTSIANELGCDYLVLLESQLVEDNPQNYGYTYVDTFEKFQVFENHVGAK